MSLTCIITGSSRGIGLGIAKNLASKGHQVILNSRSEIAPEVLAEFDGFDLPVGQMVGDISNFNEAKRLVKEVRKEYGTIDVMVNNAGITKDGLIMRMKEEAWDDVMNVNLKGTFNMCRHVAPIMIRQNAGKIINISSVAGLMGNAGQTNYAASKAGVIGLTKSLAKELASRSITVNAIAPGFIETDMTDQLSDKVKEATLDSIPLKRMGQVEDICSCVNYLIDATYVTGQVLEVNGGLHM